MSMRKAVANAMIKVGTNLLTVGVAGMLFTSDSITVLSGALAVVTGLAVLALGVKLKEAKDE